MRRPQSNAGHLHWDGPDGPGNVLVRVRLRPYRQFGRRIDHQLTQLVDRWARPGVPSFERPESFAAGPKPR